MPGKSKRIWTGLLTLLLIVTLLPQRGNAVLKGVYFTAVNEEILELKSSTMPFWSGDNLYISGDFFRDTDLDVRYVRNKSMGLAMLYTSQTDLRFDLKNRTVYDKQGKTYSGRAIQRGGEVFFPINLVCQYFDLTWSYCETDTVPLIRIKSSSAILDDKTFVDAADNQLDRSYEAYEKLVLSQGGPHTSPVQAAEGQKVHLLLESGSAGDTLRAMELLGTAQATFLLPAEQMEQGDLIRALIAKGHGVALLAQGKTPEAVAEELEKARAALWQGSLSWLCWVWYDGEAEINSLLKDTGFQRITVDVDRQDTGLNSVAKARALLTVIGRYRQDITIHLGETGNSLGGLKNLTDSLHIGRYRVCAWRAGG